MGKISYEEAYFLSWAACYPNAVLIEKQIDYTLKQKTGAMMLFEMHQLKDSLRDYKKNLEGAGTQKGRILTGNGILVLTGKPQSRHIAKKELLNEYSVPIRPLKRYKPPLVRVWTKLRHRFMKWANTKRRSNPFQLYNTLITKIKNKKFLGTVCAASNRLPTLIENGKQNLQK